MEKSEILLSEPRKSVGPMDRKAVHHRRKDGAAALDSFLQMRLGDVALDEQHRGFGAVGVVRGRRAALEEGAEKALVLTLDSLSFGHFLVKDRFGFYY